MFNKIKLKTIMLSAMLVVTPIGVGMSDIAMMGPVYAAEEDKDDKPEPDVSISIEAPEEWVSGETKIAVEAEDTKDTGNFEIVKIEAKLGDDGKWADITDTGYIVIVENCTVCFQITDQNDNVYSKSIEINCFDLTPPTVNAAVSEGILTMTAVDNESGVEAFYVNGYKYTNFTDDTLNIRLQQFDAGYEYFEIQMEDKVGNLSEVYKTKNPYYDDNPDDDDDKGASTLPVNAIASDPASATGIVTDHILTDADGNSLLPGPSEMGEEDGDCTGREFYTIETESDKVFYLIIDKSGDEETVYFLTEIDENDLLNVTENNSSTLPRNSAALESAIPTDETALSNNNVESEVSKTDSADAGKSVSDGNASDNPEGKKSNLYTYIILGIIGAGVIGVWYYLKMVKGKKENFAEEEDDESEENDDSDDEESEDGGEDEFFNTEDDSTDEEI